MHRGVRTKTKAYWHKHSIFLVDGDIGGKDRRFWEGVLGEVEVTKHLRCVQIRTIFPHVEFNCDSHLSE